MRYAHISILPHMRRGEGKTYYCWPRQYSNGQQLPKTYRDSIRKMRPFAKALECRT